jgi:cobalt-precorrin-5B (C1)-methyltransferase
MDGDRRAFASVVKDAGDDPDVTNGAVVSASVEHLPDGSPTPGINAVRYEDIWIAAGKGIGRVTRAGLPVAPGEPAINPVPRRMIHDAVAEAAAAHGVYLKNAGLLATISIQDGERLAEKTLNRRLGIEGGLSILGTTGIVKPVSAEAWTATIETSMNVARCADIREIVLSTGRTSERAVLNLLEMPEEAAAMMGDYLEFSLKAAARYGFRHIHLAAMWAKVVKAAMEIPQTHVRHGAVDADETVRFLAAAGVDSELCVMLKGCNTVREIYDRIEIAGRRDVVEMICRRAGSYAEKVSGIKTTVYLVKKSDTVSVVV